MSQGKLAIIVSLCSFLSTLVVSVLNIWFSFKSKKLGYERQVTLKLYVHKRDIFENYLTLIGEAAKQPKPTNKIDLINAYYSVLLYVPASKRRFVEEVTMDFLNKKHVSTDRMFELIDVINKEISYIPKK